MVIGLVLTPFFFVPNLVRADNETSVRVTPLVRAVQNCSASVVNLRGRKTVPAQSGDSSGQKLKQVNGMGTGVIIDPRGFVLTNYHVVQGVKEIEVTTSENIKTTATLVAHDPVTDLAILRIKLGKPLNTIKIGTSSDLMLAETVTAVGNAYGYEHTVTVGIISQLGRTVQVNDDQIYRNLIQTDAAINPGNSGGPLLNMNGEMIGINVAVRIGAQGIAFAIPVNDAMEVAAELMEQVVSDSTYHGLSTRTIFVNDQPQLMVESVDSNSPASEIGLASGDRILSVNDSKITRELDFQTSMLGVSKATPVRMEIIHGSTKTNVELQLADKTKSNASSVSTAWEALGLSVTAVMESEMINLHQNYKRGLRVTKVRPNSPAEKEGIMPGDIVVAMHGYKTETIENLTYILQRSDVLQRKSFMFYILRDKEPFWGQMRVAQRTTR